MSSQFFYVATVILGFFGIQAYAQKLIRKWRGIQKTTTSDLEGKSFKQEETTNIITIFSFYIELACTNIKIFKTSFKTQQDIICKSNLGKTVLKMNFPRSFAFLRDFNDIKEVQNFVGRPVAELAGKLRQGGMLQNNGRSWKALKKYTMKTLGQLGFMRKNQMSSILKVELQELLDHIESLRSKTGNRIFIRDLFENPVINVIWSIAAGERFSRDDPNYILLKDNTYALLKCPILKMIAMEWRPFRYLAKAFPKLFGYSVIFEGLKKVNEYFKNIIQRRQELGEHRTEKATDFIDSFLKEIDFHKNSESEDIYCVHQLVVVLFDLFQAGMETTSSALESAIMMLIKFPHVQKKMQQEIDEVLGIHGFPPNVDHKEKMPYAVATILEIHRMANVVPFNVREANENCVVGGVNFKKDSYLILHLYAVRMEGQFWGDPKTFRPERFLDKDNNFIQENVNHVLAFGGGTRTCPGEMVATWTMFVFLTGILQRYNIKAADENEILAMNDHAHLTNGVVPFHFAVTTR